MKRHPKPFTTAAALAVGALLLASCTTPYGWTAYPEAGSLADLSSEQWREDVEYLRAELPRRNPHFQEDPEMAEAFDAATSELSASIDGDTSPAEMIAGLSRAIALVGEGHTSLNTYPTSYFPVIAGWFADGFYVAGTDESYRNIIGTKIRGIRKPDGSELLLEDLEPVLNSVISVDHPNGYRPAQGQVLLDPYLMRGLGLADDTGLTYLLDRDGTPITLEVEEMPAAELSIVRASDDAPNTPIGRRSSEANWYTRVGTAEEVLYLSYDECRVGAAGLLQSVADQVKRGDVRRLIVDLRQNSGGLSVPGTWFAHQLAGVPGLRADGAIFVLIGPHTFSSGMMLAVDLMHRTNGIFAGQPLAESPNSWGEVKRFPLPNSGLMVGHSTVYFRYGRGKDLRLDEDGNLVPDPDFRIMPTFADYESGIDPVLEAALDYGA